MKYLIAVLALLVSSPPALREGRADLGPEPPGPVVVGKKGIVTAGDTLVYTISWGAGARATSYNITTAVAVTNGTWSVVRDSNSSGAWITGNGVGPLPTSGNVTGTSYRTWVAAIPWDSATFTVTVASKNAIGVSSPVTASWKVSRKPGVPGPITVDSSLIVRATLVLPNPSTIALGSSRVICAFKEFGNGAVAQWTADRASCDSIYTKYVPVAARTVSAPQQAHTDSITKTCVTWSTPSPAVTLAPMASCSAAVRATGLGLTWRMLTPVDAVRVGALGPPPTLLASSGGRR